MGENAIQYGVGQGALDHQIKVLLAGDFQYGIVQMLVPQHSGADLANIGAYFGQEAVDPALGRGQPCLTDLFDGVVIQRRLIATVGLVDRRQQGNVGVNDTGQPDCLVEGNLFRVVGIQHNKNVVDVHHGKSSR